MILIVSKLNLNKKLLSVGGIVLLITLLSFITPGIKDRFAELYNSFNTTPANVSYDSTNIRRAIFDCSISISKENLFLGIGFDNLQTKLNECYKSNYDSNFYKSENYMTHNYYSYILLSSGLLGLFFYLFYITIIIRFAFKANDLLFFIFLSTVLIICLVEDYLYRQHGLLYFNVLLMAFVQYFKTIPHKSISAISH
jgi:O-antigen ligase